MTPDQIARISLYVAGASLLVAVIALWIAWFGIRRADRNSSASLLVTLNDGLRQAWQRYLAEKDQLKPYQFAELMNLLEIGCALCNRGLLSGVSRELVEDYLNQSLAIIEANHAAREEARKLLETPKTFEEIRSFAKTRPRHARIFKL